MKVFIYRKQQVLNGVQSRSSMLHDVNMKIYCVPFSVGAHLGVILNRIVFIPIFIIKITSLLTLKKSL
jgi:hypothetical protein